jgi:hypothetical protein
LKEDVERGFAARASTFKSDLTNFCYSEASGIIVKVNGDQGRCPDLIEYMLSRVDALLGRYSEPVTFSAEIPFLPCEDEESDEEDEENEAAFADEENHEAARLFIDPHRPALAELITTIEDLEHSTRPWSAAAASPQGPRATIAARPGRDPAEIRTAADEPLAAVELITTIEALERSTRPGAQRRLRHEAQGDDRGKARLITWPRSAPAA